MGLFSSEIPLSAPLRIAYYVVFSNSCKNMRCFMGRARVIAVANQKGGVGKTTTAINMAASLSAAEKEVLLVDVDPQGNSTSGVGVDRDALEGSIYQVFMDEAEITSIIMRTAMPRLSLVPSSVDLFGAEVELAGRTGRETILKDALAPLLDSYDYIILDCPPALGLLTLNALTAVQSVLVPVQCEYYALEGLTQLLKTLDLVRNQLNPELEVEGILLTMHDNRNNLSRQVEQEVRGHFGSKVYTTVIPRNVSLSEAPSHGKPIITYDIRSRGAQSYLSLASEVINNV
jgi:chromosome partitioning protein